MLLNMLNKPFTTEYLPSFDRVAPAIRIWKGDHRPVHLRIGNPAASASTTVSTPRLLVTDLRDRARRLRPSLRQTPTASFLWMCFCKMKLHEFYTQRAERQILLTVLTLLQAGVHAVILHLRYLHAQVQRWLKRLSVRVSPLCICAQLPRFHDGWREQNHSHHRNPPSSGQPRA